MKGRDWQTYSYIFVVLCSVMSLVQLRYDPGRPF